ncbi:hypothetical protein GCM10023082_20940 [Streptomyces tremellae]|uniref:Uncharacterized protein n=1 Tax=Streptomyces tremellae TaxID=1124239 RepID=A0ABP7ESG1_9ACTN
MRTAAVRTGAAAARGTGTAARPPAAARDRPEEGRPGPQRDVMCVMGAARGGGVNRSRGSVARTLPGRVRPGRGPAGADQTAAPARKPPADLGIQGTDVRGFRR